MTKRDLKGGEIRRVGMIFSGGPAPAANAVIAGAVTAFLEDDREVVGFHHGYSALEAYNASSHRLEAGKDYTLFGEQDVRGLRNQRGICIGTARANPGKAVKKPEDLASLKHTAKLRQVHQGLVDLNCDALISIGGDDTLKTANFIYEFQKHLPSNAKRVKVVHLPKTIDNDYRGIDFTFGFFTAVDVMAKQLMNLRADALATGSYFIVEAMGRKAAWLSYGVAIAGEAHLVLGVEDVDESLAESGTGGDGSAGGGVRKLSLTKLADRIVDLMVTRERRNKGYGTVVLAEGLAEQLSEKHLEGLPRDAHGHISLGDISLGKMVAKVVAERYQSRTGRSKKVNGVQMGYEARCAAPHAFDVMLGSQLGIGAYRALVEEGLNGHMVSVTGQLDLQYVPFSELVDPETLVTEVRYVEPGSDFHRLARFLETRLDSSAEGERS